MKIDPKFGQVAPRGAQMEPKLVPGVPKWSPKLSQNTGKHIQSHFKVPLGLQNVPQSVFEAKAASSGFEIQAKSLPRPGARRRRRRSGRGLEGRAHQAVGRNPSTKLISQSVCIKLIQGGAASAAGLFQLPPPTNIYRSIASHFSCLHKGMPKE